MKSNLAVVLGYQEYHKLDVCINKTGEQEGELHTNLSMAGWEFQAFCVSSRTPLLTARSLPFWETGGQSGGKRCSCKYVNQAEQVLLEGRTLTLLPAFCPLPRLRREVWF